MTLRRGSPSNRPAWQLRAAGLGIAILSLVVTLVVAECLARWIRPDLVPSRELQSVADPFIGWRFLPGQEFDGKTEHGERRRVQINRLGFADEDHPLQKTEGAVRIAFLGDSFTVAAQVDFKDSFVQVAGTALRTAAPSRKWEVLNFGVPSFGTVREYLTWRHYASSFRPDLVVLAFFMGNDVANNLPNYEGIFEQRRGQKKRSWFYRKFLEPSLLYQQYKLCERNLRHALRKDWARKVSADEAQRPFWERSYAPIDWQTYLTRPDPAFEEAWRLTESHLLRLRDEVQASGARFYVALLPGVEAMVPGEFQRALVRYPGIEQFQFDLEYPRRRLLDFFGQTKMSVIDIQREFEENVPADQRSTLYFKFDRHFSTRGHGLTGKSIAKRIAADSRSLP